MRADGSADDPLDIPLVARDAAEDIEAEAGVLGEGMTRQVRFGEHLQSGQAAGVREPMPHRRRNRREPRGVEDGAKQSVKCTRVAQRRRIAAGGLDDPFDPDRRGQSW